MPDISRITLPSGNTYELKDAVARQAIAGGMSKIIAWNGTSVPVVANIPAGVTVNYNGTDYTGTLAVADADATGFYFVYSATQEGTSDVFDEYTIVEVGGTKQWEKIGDTSINISSLGSLAYKDNVTLAKGTGDNVLGEGTTFTTTPSAVSFSGGTTGKALGSSATFSTSVTPSVTNIKATASGVAVGADGTAAAVTGYASPTTETFVKSVTAETTNKLVTTTVPNVTSAGSASTWTFAMGTGTNSETLIISGANGSAPTLGTAKTVATGSVSSTGTGSPIVTGVTIGESAAAITGLGTPSTETVLKGVKVTSQPTVSLATGATAGTGVVSVATGISSATTTANNKDEVTAITGLGSATAAAQAITVGANDKIKVAKYDDLSVSAS